MGGLNTDPPSLSLFPRAWRFASVLALASGVAALLLFASSESSPGPQRPISASFRLLRTPSDEPQSSRARQSWRSAAVVAPTARFTDAQLAVATEDLWVVTSNHLLCLAQPRGAACAPKRTAVKEGVFLGTFHPPDSHKPRPHGFLLQGVVPDGVVQVALVVGRHRHLIVDIRVNIFSVERDKPVHLERLIWG